MVNGTGGYYSVNTVGQTATNKVPINASCLCYAYSDGTNLHMNVMGGPSGDTAEYIVAIDNTKASNVTPTADYLLGATYLTSNGSPPGTPSYFWVGDFNMFIMIAR